MVFNYLWALKTKILAYIAIVSVLIVFSRKLSILICKIKKKSPGYLTYIYVPAKGSMLHLFSEESHPVSFRIGGQSHLEKQKAFGSFDIFKGYICQTAVIL